MNFRDRSSGAFPSPSSGMGSHAHSQQGASLEPIDLGIIGSSQAIQETIRITRQVARTRACVLIVGETGTGKELVARAVHKWSPVHSGPYIRVNCGALSENLLESELFGHVKGAFTSALENRTGRFEAADHGSIFLDEVNSTTPKLQVKLLRVLQEGEFERVGDTKTVKVNTRIIAATNRDLIDEIEEGRFREDLYYRLNVVPIELPPLRERREDIPELVGFFLKRYAEINRKPPRTVHAEALELLKTHPWPGNVRELQNYIERAVVLFDDSELLPEHLPPALRGEQPKRLSRPLASSGPRSQSPALAPKEPKDFATLTTEFVRRGLRETLPEKTKIHKFLVDQIEAELIRQVMDACNHVRLKAADRLGLNRNTLHKKLEEHGIKSPDFDSFSPDPSGE